MDKRQELIHNLTRLGFVKGMELNGGLLEEWCFHPEMWGRTLIVLVPNDDSKGDYDELIVHAERLIAPFTAILLKGYGYGYRDGVNDSSDPNTRTMNSIAVMDAIQDACELLGREELTKEELTVILDGGKLPDPMYHDYDGNNSCTRCGQKAYNSGAEGPCPNHPAARTE